MANETQNPWDADPVVTAPQQGGEVNPWDNDPTMDPSVLNPQVTGGVYPRAEVENPPGGAQIPFRETLDKFVLGKGRMDDESLPDITEVFASRLSTAPVGSPLLAEAPIFQQGPPELEGANKERLAAGLLAASEPQQVVDIALANLPGSALRQDSMGNPIIDWNGQSYHAWKPGFRQQDANRLAAQGAAYTGAARVGSTLGGGILSRVLNVMGLTGGTSVGLDLGATAAGSEQGVSIPRAGGAALVGGIFEALMPAANQFARQVRRDPLDDGMTLTIEARRVLQENGIDPAALSREQTRAFARMVRDAANPDDAARMAQSQTLPVPVRETRGTATMDPSQQMFENLAAEGSFGQGAGDMMRGVHAGQHADIRANVPAIQARVSGGRPVIEAAGQGGAVAQSGLRSAKRATDVAVDAAYTAARARPALVAGGAIDDLAARANSGASPQLRHSPVARDQVTRLRAMADDPNVSVEALFDWRMETSKLYRSATEGMDIAALKGALNAFDDNIQNTVRNALMAGDEQSARMWLRAVNIRRGAGKRFGTETGAKSNDLIGELLEKEYKGRTYRLKVDPEAASNYIFGASNTKLMRAPELGRDLMRIRDRLGANSEGWRALKEEAFLRFAGKLEGAQNAATQGVSGAKFLTAWQNAMRQNPTVMRAIFNSRDIALIEQFGRVAARITNPMRGGRNYSGTSQGIASIVQRMWAATFMGEQGAALLSRIFPPMYNIVQTGKIARSVSPAAAMPLRELPRGVLPGAGAVIGKEAGDTLKLQPSSQ